MRHSMPCASGPRAAGPGPHAHAIMGTAPGCTSVDGAAVAVVAIPVGGARRQRHAVVRRFVALLPEKAIAAWGTKRLRLREGEVEARGHAVLALTANVAPRHRRRWLARTASPAHVAELIWQRTPQGTVTRLTSALRRHGVEALRDATRRWGGAHRGTPAAALIAEALPRHRGAVNARQGTRASADCQRRAWPWRWGRCWCHHGHAGDASLGDTFPPPRVILTGWAPRRG